MDGILLTSGNGLTVRRLQALLAAVDPGNLDVPLAVSVRGRELGVVVVGDRVVFHDQSPTMRVVLTLDVPQATADEGRVQ